MNVAVVPVVNPSFDQACLDSLADPISSLGFPADDILVVDNTRHGLPPSAWGGPLYRDPDGHNLGVPRAWNAGIDFMQRRDADSLTLISASMLFGPLMHVSWAQQIASFPDAAVVECDGHSWHLITFRRRIFDLVGRFDGNFYPGYFEAIDFGHRLMHAGIPGRWDAAWEVAWVNAVSRRVAGHLDIVDVLAPPLLDYYRTKWGGDKGEETFERPFGRDVGLDYFVEEPIPVLAERYNLEKWW